VVHLSDETSFVEWSFRADLDILFWGFRSSGGSLGVVFMFCGVTEILSFSLVVDGLGDYAADWT
jgi:hypothetical protein